jgi:hypothetical protein
VSERLYRFCPRCILQWVPPFGAPVIGDPSTYGWLCPRCGQAPPPPTGDTT